MQFTTLLYLEDADRYLMLHRVSKKNDMNKDKWIGIGGHMEEGETPEECIRRETREETGLELLSLEFRGLVTFVSDEFGTEYMALFTSDAWKGDLTACNEGTLEWVEKSALRNLNLWEGDYIFLDLLEKKVPWFSLKLRYQGEKLVEVIYNEQVLPLENR